MGQKKLPRAEKENYGQTMDKRRKNVGQNAAASRSRCAFAKVILVVYKYQRTPQFFLERFPHLPVRNVQILSTPSHQHEAMSYINVFSNLQSFFFSSLIKISLINEYIYSAKRFVPGRDRQNGSVSKQNSVFSLLKRTTFLTSG